MPTIDTILDSIQASRGEFADAFLRAQCGVPLEQRKEFEAVARKADDREAFRIALRIALAENWLEDLVDTLIESDRTGGKLLLSRLTEKGAGNAEIQAITNAARGFADPEQVIRGLIYGKQWTCKILVDHQPRGTGVLIARHLVLTAWHVIQPLFHLEDGEWISDRLADRLEVEFDDLLVQKGKTKVPTASFRVPAHTPWCTSFCICHDDELADGLPENLTALDGRWDFAVIRLARPLEAERGCATLDPRAAVPRAKAKIYVFQHPKGVVLKMDDGEIVAADDTTRCVVPRIRFLHRVNATEGSSGGPCFDQSFALFGLHQGVWTRGNGAEKTINRGIPISRICEFLSHVPDALPPLEPAEIAICELPGSEEPVIGCGAFQSEVWGWATSAQKPLILISGDQGSGKTFRTHVQHAILPEINHLKIAIEAALIAKMDAASLAAEIGSKAGARSLDLLPRGQAHTTISAWLKAEVVPKLMLALDGARGKRLVWLTLLNLNHAEIEGENASEFLYLLYEQVLAVDWLRIILDGMAAPVPVAIADKIHREDVGAITEADIMTYLTQALGRHGLAVAQEDLQVHAVQLVRAYQRLRNVHREDAVRELVAQIKELKAIYLEVGGARGIAP